LGWFFAALFLTGCGAIEEAATEELGLKGYARPLSSVACSWDIGSMRGEWDVNVAISGPARSRAIVDLTLPGDVAPLRVQAQYNKQFADSDEWYVHQTYRWDTEWSAGSYLLSIQNQGDKSEAHVTLTSEADWVICVYCN